LVKQGSNHGCTRWGCVADRSIIVRGARLLSTLAPYADEQAVYPGSPLPPDAGPEYAVSFSIPMDAPGMVFLCRDSGTKLNSNPVDAPFSIRFDEQDAFCIFDDVEIPARHRSGTPVKSGPTSSAPVGTSLHQNWAAATSYTNATISRRLEPIV